MKIFVHVQGMTGPLRVNLKPGDAILLGQDPNPRTARIPPGIVTTAPQPVRIQSGLASTNHALVVAHETGAWVLDLQSRNGTSVRYEDGALHLVIAPPRMESPKRPALPERAVWTNDEDFAASVCAQVTRWLREAGADADAAILARGETTDRTDTMHLATDERLVVTLREGTRDLRLTDDILTVRRFVERQNALHAEEGGHEREFVLRSPALREAHQTVYEATRRGLNLLVNGPPGSGKERLARCYHEHSTRSDREFVAVNCGAIPAALFENELFGSVPGGHAGAVDKPGLFELAHRGTLFLDEVAEIPLVAQAALLRAIEYGTFRRLGEVRERRVDVKVVCATNRDLLAAVRDGRFREDLYGRIAGKIVTVAPLRERPEDIDGLLRALGVSDDGPRAWDVLTPAAREVVQKHPWPGNVRALMQFVRQLPDAPGATVDADACRRLLAAPAPEARPTVTVARITPTAPAEDDWRGFESRVWGRWLRDHGSPPATFRDLMDFVEEYLKPAFVAWRANVPDDLRSLDAIEVNPLARQLGVDWKTAHKWLKRYFDTLKSREGG